MHIKTKHIVLLLNTLKEENDKKGIEDDGTKVLKEVSMIYLDSSDSWEIFRFHLKCSFKIFWSKLKLRLFGVGEEYESE